MKKSTFVLSIFTLLLSACGGGGSGGVVPVVVSPVVVDPQVAPVAAAGSDQTITTANTSVALDGSASSDTNGDSLTYSWSLTSIPEGSAATLSEPAGSSPEFTPDINGNYIIELVVNDGTEDSATDSVTIVLDIPNEPPTGDAGPDQNVETGSLVTLDGSESTDLEGDTLTFDWVLSAPTGSGATLSDTAAVSPTFTADIDGTYSINLSVSDDAAQSAIDEVIVNATTTNAAPVASAGADQNVATGSLVTLDASASSDANGDMLSHIWTLTNLPTSSIATLSDSTSSSPQFTADVAGIYEATLVVNDGSEDSAISTVMITAQTANSAPTANAGINQNITTTAAVTLDGSASSDADGDTLAYLWALTSVPTGSSASITDQTLVAPMFTADRDGSYVAQLIVSDGVASSAPDTVIIVAETLNSAPIASAGTSQNVVIADVVVLDGSGSSDADGDTLSYAWSFSSLPLGSLAVFDDATSVSPSFTADLAGSYVAGLIVNDGTEESASATVSIEATSPVIRLYENSFFGESEKSWPYFSSGVASVSILGSTTYTLDEFKLKAVGQNFTIANLVTTDFSFTVSPVFVGLAGGDVIVDGTEVTFTLVSPLTGGVMTNLSYKFEILETGERFEYTRSLQTN